MIEERVMADRERRIASLRELRALIREDRRHNGRATWPGFQAMALHRFGVWKDGIRRKPLRIPFTVLYRVGYLFVRNVYGIELPVTARIGRRVSIGHQHGIIVHPNAVIGDDCLIRQGVALGQDRQMPGVLLKDIPAPKLGRGVEVGAGAIIIGNVTIGDGVRIGPNAVVMTDVPAGAIVTAPLSRIMVPPKRKPKPAPEPAPEPAAETTPETAADTAADTAAGGAGEPPARRSA
jgi:serine O-acetyltransferase